MKINIKAGDEIRIIKKESLFYNKILTVSHVDSNGFIFVDKMFGLPCLPLIYTSRDIELIDNDNKNKFKPGDTVNVVKATSRQKGKHGKIVRIKYTKENTLYIVKFKHTYKRTYKRTYKAWEIQAVDDHNHQNCRCK